MSVDNPKSNILVIDTENYSGNFEREMCAYITGQVGECGVGEELAELAKEDIKHLAWWEEHIVNEKDDNGCERPASIWDTPGWFNNGMGGQYKIGSPEALKAGDDSYQAMKSYNASQVKAITKRLENNDFETTPNGWTKEACENTLKSINDKLEEMKNKVPQYPAYLSVAIFVDVFPPKEVWEECMTRAKYFAENYHKVVEEVHGYNSDEPSLTLTGFRQIETKHTMKTKKKNNK